MRRQRLSRGRAQILYNPNGGASGLPLAAPQDHGATPPRSCSRVMAMTTFSIVFVATFVALVVVIAVVLRRTVFRD